MNRPCVSLRLSLLHPQFDAAALKAATSTCEKHLEHLQELLAGKSRIHS